VINKKLTADTGMALSDAVIARALTKVTFTTDPLATTFPVLLKAGAKPVSAGGLGTE